MNIFDAIIQGIVQGLTEFLPVSSSGHLAISQHILGVTEDNLFFNVMLHVGTLVAVCAVYYKLIIRLFKALGGMVADICRGKFKWSEMDEDRNLIIMLVIGLLPLFLLFVPLPFSGGLAAKDLAEIWSGNTGYFIIVGISLIFTCILLTIGIFMNRYTTRKYAEKGIVKKNGAGRVRYNILDALCVGIAQFFCGDLPRPFTLRVYAGGRTAARHQQAGRARLHFYTGNSIHFWLRHLWKQLTLFKPTLCRI